MRIDFDSPAVKQGVIYAVYTSVIVLFLASWASYLGIFNNVASYLAVAITGAAVIVIAIVAFISGFVSWYIVDFTGNAIHSSQKAIIQGVFFGIWSLLSGNIIGAVASFIVGYALWWLSTDSSIY